MVEPWAIDRAQVAAESCSKYLSETSLQPLGGKELRGLRGAAAVVMYLLGNQEFCMNNTYSQALELLVHDGCT